MSFKKLAIWAWAALTLLLLASVFRFQFLPMYRLNARLAIAAEAKKTLGCVRRTPQCVPTEWSSHAGLRQSCSGMPCLSDGNRYEFKRIQTDDDLYLLARLTKAPDAWLVWIDLREPKAESFKGADPEFIQCRDQTATAGVFNSEAYQPEFRGCAFFE